MVSVNLMSISVLTIITTRVFHAPDNSTLSSQRSLEDRWPKVYWEDESGIINAKEAHE